MLIYLYMSHIDIDLFVATCAFNDNGMLISMCRILILICLYMSYIDIDLFICVVY